MSQQFNNNKYAALFVPAGHKNFGKNKKANTTPGAFTSTRSEIRAARQAAQAHLPRAPTPPPRPISEPVMSRADKNKIIECKLNDLYEGKRDLQDMIESLKCQKRDLNQSIIDDKKAAKAAGNFQEKKSERTNINSFAYRANQGVSRPGFTYNLQRINRSMSDIMPAEYVRRHERWLHVCNDLSGWEKAEEGVLARGRCPQQKGKVEESRADKEAGV